MYCRHRVGEVDHQCGKSYGEGAMVFVVEIYLKKLFREKYVKLSKTKMMRQMENEVCLT